MFKKVATVVASVMLITAGGIFIVGMVEGAREELAKMKKEAEEDEEVLQGS